MKDEGTSKVRGIIEVDGIAFEYVRQGQGDPIIVIGSSVYYPKAGMKPCGPFLLL